MDLSLEKKLPDDINPSQVFAANELNLREIKVYGFDYDYTLAHYEPSVEYLIYELGKNALITKFHVSFHNSFALNVVQFLNIYSWSQR